MSQTTIEDLPLEILTKVLENLSIRDMKSASLVCQLWNEIISTSSKFLEKTSISINVSNNEQLEAAEDVKFCRKYRHFKVFSRVRPGLELIRKIDKINQNVINQISKCAIFIQNLVIDHIELNGSLLLYFLRLCIFLEKLELNNVKIIKCIEIDCFEGPKKVVFEQKLKMLKVSDCDWILKHLTIKNANLDHLCLGNWNEKKCESTFSIFLAFLHRLENVNVEKLCLSCADMNSNFRLCPKFKWKKLKIFHLGGNSHSGLKTIESDFWKQILSVAQVDSFVDLSWYHPVGTIKSLLKFIAENKNITRLKVNFGFDFDLSEHHDRHQLKTFKHINKLEIASFFCDPEFPFSQFPSVESLKVSAREIQVVLLNKEMLSAHFQMATKVEDDYYDDFLDELITKSFVTLYNMVPKAKIFEIEIEDEQDSHVTKTRQQIESEIFANRL